MPDKDKNPSFVFRPDVVLLGIALGIVLTGLLVGIVTWSGMQEIDRNNQQTLTQIQTKVQELINTQNTATPTQQP